MYCVPCIIWKCWRNLLRGYILFICKITFKVTDRAFRMGLEQRSSFHYWANDRYGLGGQAGQERAIKMSYFFFGPLVVIPQTHWVFTECHMSYGKNSDYLECDLREWYLANWYPVLVWQQPRVGFCFSAAPFSILQAPQLIGKAKLFKQNLDSVDVFCNTLKNWGQSRKYFLSPWLHWKSILLPFNF